MEFSHEPVLVSQIQNHLNLKKGDWHIDMTAGGGGHLDIALALKANCFAFDQDQDSFKYLVSKYKNLGWNIAKNSKIKVLLEKEDQQLFIINSNFVNFEKFVDTTRFKSILFDFGMSSYQIEESGRGFSFMRDELLDMRMNKELKITASDLINVLGVNELTELFFKYGEDKFSKIYAKEIVKQRKIKKIETTKDLVDIVMRVCPVKKRERLHPATRIFQALRIAVNDELHSIQICLPKIALYLEKGGKILAITFHSLEYKLVTEFIAKRSGLNFKIETIMPDEAEVSINPRSRSAKLTVLTKEK